MERLSSAKPPNCVGVFEFAIWIEAMRSGAVTPKKYGGSLRTSGLSSWFRVVPSPNVMKAVYSGPGEPFGDGKKFG